jgi:hypothetical protein
MSDDDSEGGRRAALETQSTIAAVMVASVRVKTAESRVDRVRATSELRGLIESLIASERMSPVDAIEMAMMSAAGVITSLARHANVDPLALLEETEARYFFRKERGPES